MEWEAPTSAHAALRSLLWKYVCSKSHFYSADSTREMSTATMSDYGFSRIEVVAHDRLVPTVAQLVN